MPQPDQAESVAQAVFTALADPTRRGILAELAARGPATATDLAARLPISRQAIAKHLGLLSEAGLVRAEAGERTNWRGDTATRRVVPEDIWFGSTEWHPREQWFLRATDLEKGEVRDFAFADIVFDKTTST